MTENPHTDVALFAASMTFVNAAFAVDAIWQSMTPEEQEVNRNNTNAALAIEVARRMHEKTEAMMREARETWGDMEWTP
jgi:hypothetical protein